MQLASLRCFSERVLQTDRRVTLMLSRRSNIIHLKKKSVAYTTYNRSRSSPFSAASLKPNTDVVVVGSGVIGLSIALAILEVESNIAVTVVDKNIPCSGATGAGQGYIWLCHRDSTSPAWELAVHSKQLWEEWLHIGAIPNINEATVEYQANGSMLIARSAEESVRLQERQQLLQAAGVQATHVEAGIATRLEQSLHLPPEGSALLVPDDFQISGRQTAAALQSACAAHGPRFTALFHEGVEKLVVGPSGRIEGVQTAERRISAGVGVIVAAGAWSGELLSTLPSEGKEGWEGVFRPRKGLLLEMPRPQAMPEISRGMMEMGYTKHHEPVGGVVESPEPAESGPFESVAADVTFTATTSAAGTLLVGSSREFSGYDSHADPLVMGAIMQRAVEFLPGLLSVKPEEILVRAGPRPYSSRGLPLVGPVPGAEGLFVAAGHEGSGLTLAPATAELMCHHMLGTKSNLPNRVVNALRP